MRTVSLEELLEAGCHFGHQVSRQNAKARDYIFEARDNIHIIDLEKTKEGLEDAAKFVKDVAKRNGNILVLGTKRQAQNVLEEERKKIPSDAGMYFVTKRWIGGTLTNYSEVAKNFRKLKDITARLQDSRERAKYTKKELSDWDKTRLKLEGFYGGIVDMPGLPDAIFIIDTHQEHVAAGEAKLAGIPTVGITDTNADPTIISYPIPANDDAVGSLQLLISYIFEAWMEGKKIAEKEAVVEAAQEEKAKEEIVKKEEKTTKEVKKEKKEKVTAKKETKTEKQSTKEKKSSAKKKKE